MAAAISLSSGIYQQQGCYALSVATTTDAGTAVCPAGQVSVRGEGGRRDGRRKKRAVGV